MSESQARPNSIREQVAQELSVEAETEAGAQSLDLGSATYTKMLSRRQ